LSIKILQYQTTLYFNKGSNGRKILLELFLNTVDIKYSFYINKITTIYLAEKYEKRKYIM
jgi:hypothetical protein